MLNTMLKGKLHMASVTHAELWYDGSGIISVNGAAARKCQVGDRLIIATYAQYTEEELIRHKPKLVYLDECNKIVRASNTIPVQVA